MKKRVLLSVIITTLAVALYYASPTNPTTADFGGSGYGSSER